MKSWITAGLFAVAAAVPAEAMAQAANPRTTLTVLRRSTPTTTTAPVDRALRG
jgi:hypothetical protein